MNRKYNSAYDAKKTLDFLIREALHGFKPAHGIGILSEVNELVFKLHNEMFTGDLDEPLVMVDEITEDPVNDEIGFMVVGIHEKYGTTRDWCKTLREAEKRYDEFKNKHEMRNIKIYREQLIKSDLEDTEEDEA